MVSTYLRSPMTIWELFLYGMTMVGLGSLLLCAFGWYGSRGFWVIPACRLFLTLNISLLTEMTQNRLSRHWKRNSSQLKNKRKGERPAGTIEHLLGEGRRLARSVLFGVNGLRVRVREGDTYCLAVFHEDGLGGCDTRVLKVLIRHHSLGHMKLGSLDIVVIDSRSVFFSGSPIGHHNGVGLSLRWRHPDSRRGRK